MKYMQIKCVYYLYDIINILLLYSQSSILQTSTIKLSNSIASFNFFKSRLCNCGLNSLSTLNLWFWTKRSNERNYVGIRPVYLQEFNGVKQRYPSF